MSPRRGDLLAVVLLLGLAGLLTVRWAGQVAWTPDALFYQARVLELRGASTEQALDEVFRGPLADGSPGQQASLRVPSGQPLPAWVTFRAQFFHRRILVPLAAAAVYDVFGTDSLVFVSILAAFALGPLLYGFLRLRFSRRASLISAALCMLWPPLRWAFLPLTDVWGLALEIVALIAIVLVIERGLRWLPLWFGSVLALGLTRDVTVVVMVPALALLIFRKYELRSAVALVLSGAVAALPAALIFGAPWREQLAWELDHRIPPDTSLSFIAHHYPAHVLDLLQRNFSYVTASDPAFLHAHGLLLPFAALFVAALVFLLTHAGPQDSNAFLTVTRASVLGGVLFLLVLPAFSFLRLELVFLPAVAVGLALGIDRITARRSPTAI